MNKLIEKRIESTVTDAVGSRAVKVMKGIGKLAAHQGGSSMAENYHLLAKRALIGAGAVIGSNSGATCGSMTFDNGVTKVGPSSNNGGGNNSPIPLRRSEL